MAKKSNKTDDQFAQVESALTKTEQYIEDNQAKLMRIVAVIIAVIALFIGYQNLYLLPLEDEATSEMFTAEIYFAKDSFKERDSPAKTKGGYFLILPNTKSNSFLS